MRPDRANIADLYGRHFNFVWRAVRAMGLDPATAEDTVQDVFIVAARRLSTFDASRSERAWLLGIARNLVLRHRRSSARYARRLEQLPAPDGPSTPHDAAQRSQAAQLLMTFLAQLDEPTRLSFVMADLEGLKGREVADALRIPLQTHYTRVRAARKRFSEFSASIAAEGGPT